MKHITGVDFKFKDTCVAFGFFDGIHLGHRAVLDALVREGQAANLATVLLSYDRDDARNGVKILNTEEEKAWLIGDIGPQTMVSMSVDGRDPASEAFLKETLVDRLGAKIVVVGENYADLPLLFECAARYGIKLVQCPTVMVDGEAVSTGRIMEELRACNIEKATELLGHPYLVMGKVVYGKQLGRTVGVPTANIEFNQNKLLPPDGSYATMTTIEGEKRKGLTNIGRRPTVDSFDYVTVENHVLDFSGDLYGQVIPLEVHFFIRGVFKFNSLDEVKNQIGKDMLAIRERFDAMQ